MMNMQIPRKKSNRGSRGVTVPEVPVGETLGADATAGSGSESP